MSGYKTRDLSMLEAIREIGNGTMQLPDFQRDFVWPEAARKSLLDSIWRSYPVGALLLLEIDVASDQASPFGKQLFDGVRPALETEKVRWLVLDGQQRLTSSYRSFHPEAFTSGQTRWMFLDLKALFEKTGGAAGVDIDLASMLKAQPKGAQPTSFLLTHDLLPLTMLFPDPSKDLTTNRNEFRHSIQGYINNLRSDPATFAFGEFMQVNFFSYVDSFADYKFPCVVLDAGLDLEAVANVFTKLNSGGKRLSAFDLCVSRLFPSGVSLKQKWANVKTDSGVAIFDQDGTGLLQTVALLANKSPKKAGLVKVIDKTAIDAYWDNAVSAMNEVGAILSEFGVSGKKTLPYDSIGPALAAAHHTAPNPTGPNEIADRTAKIRKWVIQTAFTQRYTEGSDAKKSEDYPQALKWFTSGESPEFLTDVQWHNKIHLLGNSATSARYKALLSMLNFRKPQDFIQPTVVLGLENGATQAEIHHIFPKAYIKSLTGSAKDADLAFNMTFLSSASNNFISAKDPATYLKDLTDSWRGGVYSGLTEDQLQAKLKDLLASHFVNEEAMEALLANDFDKFIQARAETVKNEITMLGIPVNITTLDDETLEEIDAEDDTESD